MAKKYEKAGARTTERIHVAIMDRDLETQREVTAAAGGAAEFDVHVLPDAAAYFEVYGSAGGPDILLVGLDVQAQEVLGDVRRLIALTPTCGVIAYGRNATMELLAEAMAVGARRYVPLPFEDGALVSAIAAVRGEMKPIAVTTRDALPAAASTGEQAVEATSKVVTVFSPKGGVGTSTVAVNLACALQAMGHSVVLVDGNVSFGNAEVFFNVSSRKNMLHVIGDPHGIQPAAIEEVLLTHASGVKLLQAPLNPEEAESVLGEHLRAIIGALRTRYDFVVVDTWPSYDERVLAMLEVADQVLVPTGPELPSVKNLASFLRVARLLGYSQEKIVPVLMRADSVPSVHLLQIEGFLKQPLVWRIVSDGRRVTQSLNTGKPFVISDPTAPVSQNIFALASMLDGRDDARTIPMPRSRAFWKRPLFGLRMAG